MSEDVEGQVRTQELDPEGEARRQLRPRSEPAIQERGAPPPRRAAFVFTRGEDKD